MIGSVCHLFLSLILLNTTVGVIALPDISVLADQLNIYGNIH